jgi:hypothetical protein
MPNLACATNLHNVGAPGRYGIRLDAEWSANGHCTAGYLVSLIARAVLADARADFIFPGRINARYLQVTSPGCATVDVDPVHIGAGGADCASDHGRRGTVRRPRRIDLARRRTERPGLAQGWVQLADGAPPTRWR